MDIADQIEKLKSLRDTGALTEEEFTAAKQRILLPEQQQSLPSHSNQYPRQQPLNDQSLGRAANRYVSMQIVMAIIGAAAFLIFLFTVILPATHRPRIGFPF